MATSLEEAKSDYTEATGDGAETKADFLDPVQNKYSLDPETLPKVLAQMTPQELDAFYKIEPFLAPVILPEAIKRGCPLKIIVECRKLNLWEKLTKKGRHQDKIFDFVKKGLTAAEIDTLLSTVLQIDLLFDEDLNLPKELLLSVDFRNSDLGKDPIPDYMTFDDRLVFEVIKSQFKRSSREEAIRFLTDTLPRLLPHQVIGLHVGMEYKEIQDNRCTALLVKVAQSLHYSYAELIHLQIPQLEILSEKGISKNTTCRVAVQKDPSAVTLEQVKSTPWIPLYNRALKCGLRFNQIAGKDPKAIQEMLKQSCRILQ